MKIKVCGLRDNIKEVVALNPDFIGFIFYPKSKRYLGSMPASDILNIPRKIQKVGVFVNQKLEQVCELTHRYDLQYVQLHGEESVSYCQQLKEECPVAIIKVFAGNDLPSVEEIHSFGAVVDYYMFDTKNETYGGSGVKFDWNNIKGLNLPKPIFLSGGLEAEDIKSSELSGVDIFAIDVNSRFEVSPGRKNIELLKKLMEYRDEVYS